MSMMRYCHFYKAKNKKWYMELAPFEYGERDTSTTYGPFSSMEDAEDFLYGVDFSNPGGYSIDESGKAPTPEKSPDGGSVVKPRKDTWGHWQYGSGTLMRI